MNKPVTALTRPLPGSTYSVSSEARALEFFRLQVAPELSLRPYKDFWMTAVLQISHHEPAVHHALATISSLYEGLNDECSSSLRHPREIFAIKQYNMALKHVTAPGIDKNILLLVCLLFICVESLQSNRGMAIEHCRHGIIISNEPSTDFTGWARELQTVFLRMATLPFFFGENVDFPRPVGLAKAATDSDEDFDLENMGWDYLVNRTVRLVREGIGNRRGPLRHEPVPEALFTEQRHLLSRISIWDQHFSNLRTGKQQANLNDFENSYCEIQCIVGKIWANCCLEDTTARYDQHMADFERILSLTAHIISIQTRTRTRTKPRPRFIFEMGFIPILYFVTLNCRRLDLRLLALRHALILSCEREHLFNAKTIYTVGLRVVELEHGIQLDPSQPEYEGAHTAPLPPLEARFIASDIADNIKTEVDENGQMARYVQVHFVMEPTSAVPEFHEWVKIGPLESMSL